jgi:hypothetical protein
MKTEPRRSMSVALQPSDLPPEAIALIRAGTPRSLGCEVEGPAESAVGQGEKPQSHLLPAPETITPASPLAPTESTIASSGATRLPIPDGMTTPGAKTGSAVLPAFAAITVRIPSEIPKRLLRAATDRKINQQSPFTQQEIVAQALEDWLQTHGY